MQKYFVFSSQGVRSTPLAIVMSDADDDDDDDDDDTFACLALASTAVSAVLSDAGGDVDARSCWVHDIAVMYIQADYQFWATTKHYRGTSSARTWRRITTFVECARTNMMSCFLHYHPYELSKGHLT